MYSSLLRFRTFIFSMGCCAIAIAVMVLTGWQFNIPLLKALLPGLTPMNPVTAMTFILCGVWIILFSKQRLQYRDILAVIISIVGLIHFITYFFPVRGVRMDYILYGEDIRRSGVPNLIAPNTALNFLLCGVSMLLTGRGNRNAQVFRQCLLVFSFLLVYISILGYVFDIQPAYRFGGLTPMALITSTAFVFVVLGLMLSDTRFGLINTFASPLNGGRLMRQLVPLILCFPPLINYLGVIGEKKGWYTQELGSQLSTFIFTIFLLIFISFYAVLSNKQHRAEKEQDQKFASLMESINEGIIETDGEGNIVYVNESFEKIMGYTADEVKGMSALDVIIPGRDRASFHERIERRKQGIEESYLSELIDKKGEKKQIAVYAKPLYDSEGNFKSILVSLRDTSEEVRHLQDIRAFTDFAAHDLKAPLVNLTMLVEVIKSTDLDKDQLQVIDMVEETTEKMRRLIDELLQFSRIGAKELTREAVDTSAIVKDVLKSLDVTRHKIISDDLPVIEANEATSRQLFTNLLSNAVKYSSKAAHPEIKINTYQKDGATWFAISDNGIGIDPKFIPQMFQPFKRFNSQFKGNGLGLAIVKRIIEKHGGNIEVTLPETGGGMRFDFTLTPEKRMI